MTDRQSCWHHVVGEGPRVALVHGVMDRSTSFGRVVRHLDGLSVVQYDRRGYGRSCALAPAPTIDAQVTDLVAALGGVPAVVFGHSHGGTIALAAAQRHPDLITGVVAYEFPMPWTDWWPGDSAGAAALAAGSSPEDAAERFMRRIVGDARWQRLPPSTRTARRAEGGAMVTDLEQLRRPHPPAFDPSAIEVPLIVAHGTTGSLHHRRSPVVVAEAARDARVEVVEGAGHGVHLSHPERVASLVRELLSR